MSEDVLKEPRNYGGWRRKRGLGLFGLSPIETVYCFTLVSVSVYAMGWIRSIIIPALIICSIGLSLLIRVEGVPLWTHLHREFALLIAKAKGGGEYVSSLAFNSDGKSGQHLPGALAPTKSFDIARRGAKVSAYGIIWNDALKTATATWRAHPHTPHLADQDQVDAWVSSWHQFLASLGYIDQLSHVAVTVVTATEPGAVVSENIANFRAANAPEVSKKLLSELSARESDGTIFSETLISVTFDTKFGPAYRKKDPVDRIEHVVGLVTALERDLRMCGLASVKLLNTEELSAINRGAFSPSIRKEIFAALKRGDYQGLTWKSSGPLVSASHRNYYEHDQAITVGWVLGDAPRGFVSEEVLYNLMSPGTYPKRVSFIWNPTPADRASQILEKERTSSEARRILRQKSHREESARDEHDRQMAEMAAADEARGAGLGDFTIIVSSTLEVGASASKQDIEQYIESARVEIESRAKQSKLLLRRATGHHDLVFLGSLPAGINPTTLAKE